MLRLLEMMIPEEKKTEAEPILKEDKSVEDFWYNKVSQRQVLVKILVDAEESQSVMDKLEDNFGGYEEFRLLLFEVNATVPRPKEEEEEEGEEESEEEESSGSGISREELYSLALDKSEMSNVYLLLIALSSVVATIGVLRNEVAVIVGAMVIAPMLGPNVGLSLATTLADTDLAKKALRTNLIGIILTFVLSILIGLVLTVGQMRIDPSVSQLSSRTAVGIADIVLALAAGSAGALAYTRGISESLIGVMVAIALVPTLVASGLLFGAGRFYMGLGALLLFLVNLICINLSGVLTFLIQGIEPRTWWDADKAKRMSKRALLVWIVLLMILILAVIYLQGQWFSTLFG